MKLNIILFGICIFLVHVITLYQNLINQKKVLIQNFQQNQNILTQKIKDIYNDKVKLEQENRELTKAAKNDSFNWYQDISNTNVIKQLQKN